MSTHKNSFSTTLDSLLGPKKQAFADLNNRVASMIEDQRNKTGDTPGLQTIAAFGDAAVELIQHLETAAASPRHIHGPTTTTRTDASDNSYNPTYNNQEVVKQDVNHHTDVAVLSERIYRLSPDMIVSTSGQFVFRPKSCELTLAVEKITLTETEAQALYDRMAFDYGFR